MKNFIKKHIDASMRRVISKEVAASSSNAGNHNGYGGFFGSKFFGGIPYPTDEYIPYNDINAMRRLSAKMWNENIYIRGILRRLVTNEVNTGLSLEATPEEAVIGVAEQSLDVWAENVENAFELWGDDRESCDYVRQMTFGQIQQLVKQEAYLMGDVLVVLRQSKVTKLPQIQLISGMHVYGGIEPRKGNRIVDGVELDSRGRHVAYHVQQEDMTTKRIPAFGERSGRRIAWLVYGCDKRMHEVRGVPLCGLILQSAKEIDRYRDSVQRKAVINSMLALFVKKTTDKGGSLPISGGATKRTTVEPQQSATENSQPRQFTQNQYLPGMVIHEMQEGEEPVAFESAKTDLNFGEFERTIISAIAFANEIPPEILLLSFSSNYSASQAAIQEFKMYLNKVRKSFGSSFCQHVFTEWLISHGLLRSFDTGNLIASWRDPMRRMEYMAWTKSSWSGAIKPSADMLKTVKSYQLMLEMGVIDRARAARELTGMKFSKVVKALTRENAQLANANSVIIAALAGQEIPDDEDTEEK